MCNLRHFNAVYSVTSPLEYAWKEGGGRWERGREENGQKGMKLREREEGRRHGRDERRGREG